MPSKIYLDNNASTPLDPRVLAIIEEDLRNNYGNPSSSHSLGQESRKRLTQARHSIATYFKVKPSELVFTSGGTEAINMVIRGLFQSNPTGHIITSSVEHSCVYATVKAMEANGTQATFLSPGLWGAVTVDAVKAAIQSDTRLLAFMAVNNETGVKTDIEGIAALAEERGIPFLVDGVALLGKELFTIPTGVSAICFSGHKLHAPKGIGFAIIRKSLKLSPLLTGGNQENGHRGGTENITGIVALAKALELLKEELPQASQRMQKLRDYFEAELLSRLPNVHINGEGPRVVNTSDLSFDGVEGETLLAALDMEGVAASHGSACASGALEPSRILLNMGIPREQARSSVRFSLSRFTTAQEIEDCLEIVIRVVNRLRLKTKGL
jgi:cysteine desulfurase